MTPVRYKLALGIILAAAVFCAAIIATPGRCKFELSLDRVLDVRDTNALSSVDFRFPIDNTNEDSVVVMRVQNVGPRTLTLGHERVQCRVAGRWQAPEEPSWLNSRYFAATVAPRSVDHFVVAVVPRQAETFRLSCEYHYESLAERWYNLAAYHSSPGNTKLPKGLAWACGCLRSRVLAPMRRWSLSARWPKVVQEFSVPTPPQRIVKEIDADDLPNE